MRGLRAAGLFALLAAAAVTGMSGTGQAQTVSRAASTTYYPSSPNGYKIYLSQACHDGGTGSCRPNYGCGGYNENVGSARIATSSLYNRGYGSGLLDRGYTVRIGRGFVSENITDSNNFGPKLHIPIHSNASGSCPNSAAGTWALYRSTNGQDIGNELVYAIGASSPGTSDKTVYRTDLGEINNTNAVAGYLEAGFHTNQAETDWLNRYNEWSWRLGFAVDRCFGYPRGSTAPTSTKYCAF